MTDLVSKYGLETDLQYFRDLYRDVPEKDWKKFFKALDIEDRLKNNVIHTGDYFDEWQKLYKSMTKRELLALSMLLDYLFRAHDVAYYIRQQLICITFGA